MNRWLLSAVVNGELVKEIVNTRTEPTKAEARSFFPYHSHEIKEIEIFEFMEASEDERH